MAQVYPLLETDRTDRKSPRYNRGSLTVNRKVHECGRQVRPIGPDPRRYSSSTERRSRVRNGWTSRGWTGVETCAGGVGNCPTRGRVKMTKRPDLRTDPDPRRPVTLPSSSCSTPVSFPGPTVQSLFPKLDQRTVSLRPLTLSMTVSLRPLTLRGIRDRPRTERKEARRLQSHRFNDQ